MGVISDDDVASLVQELLVGWRDQILRFLVHLSVIEHDLVHCGSVMWISSSENLT